MLVLALVAVTIAGCIFTSTVVISKKIIPNADGEPIVITNLSYSGGKQVVDLTDNETFNDYKDNIKNIDNVGFYLEAENNLFSPTMFQLFLVPDTSKDYSSPQMLVDSLADLVFTGVTIPARSKVAIDWNESMEYITNLDLFKSTLESGVFSLYLAALDRETGQRDNFNIRVDSLVVIITLTGKK